MINGTNLSISYWPLDWPHACGRISRSQRAPRQTKKGMCMNHREENRNRTASDCPVKDRDCLRLNRTLLPLLPDSWRSIDVFFSFFISAAVVCRLPKEILHHATTSRSDNVIFSSDQLFSHYFILSITVHHRSIIAHRTVQVSQSRQIQNLYRSGNLGEDTRHTLSEQTVIFCFSF